MGLIKWTLAIIVLIVLGLDLAFQWTGLDWWWHAIIAVVVLSCLILVIFLIDVAQRECNSNNDCDKLAYCGTDHECHPYPDEIVVKEHNYVPASLILGISIVLAAYILKGGQFPKFKIVKKEK